MSGGAGMVAAAIVQRVASKLGNIAWERIELMWRFKEDAQEMKDKMVTLQVALSHADKHIRGTDDALAQHWLEKYKSLAYDIEDGLDELEANALIWKWNPKTLKLCFSSVNPIFVRITMSNKMRSIRVRLHKIAENAKKFNFVPPSASTEHANYEMGRETYVGGRDDVQMVGREREKKHILHEVLEKYGDRGSSIIPIVGLGGMGKTTVAKFVYTHKETTEFDLKAWVHVSMEFELKRIVCDIIYQLDSRIIPAKDTSLHRLKSQLDHILSGKLYLIVLDDLWEERGHHLEKLVTMLPPGEKGSKIIVTTRSEKVASTLSVVGASYFHIVDPIKLEGLSDYECWSIMKPLNLGDGQSTDLADIGQEISRRCNGVPLVAKALGYVMRKHCTRGAWLEIKDSNILDIKDDDKGILKGLLLSYHHMAPPLKLCFMYCSIFPKSHEIDHDILIQQWIALGFIQDADGQSLQILGTQYVEELFGMSFLTSSTSPTFANFSSRCQLQGYSNPHLSSACMIWCTILQDMLLVMNYLA
ncbi:putative disease resistance protein RGA1 isoform X2 [Panicum virgatum]|uniref:putative disease resistance protein RGA1 isoform X2 n=1 Tax=Panicum virgatum TaxID=38727 RepID=UPI0019D5F40D|nr:putative disease resistance protein RGA1 isoform X2 [Panicum virgatum]